MFRFKNIAKTAHYAENHERDVPWLEAVGVILRSSKTARRKQDAIEIENDRYYILCRLEDDTLFVINAKRKR